MKKITTLIICLIALAGVVTAQNVQSSEIGSLLDRLSQLGNNSGNVSDYFTAEEQAALRNHFISEQDVVLPAAYYNVTGSAIGESTGINTNTKRPANVDVRFQGT